MHDGLHSSHSCNPSVEVVEGSVIPSCNPEKKIVSNTEEPDERKVGNGDYTSAICHIAASLSVDLIPAAAVSIVQFVHPGSTY